MYIIATCRTLATVRLHHANSVHVCMYEPHKHTHTIVVKDKPICDIFSQRYRNLIN